MTTSTSTEPTQKSAAPGTPPSGGSSGRKLAQPAEAAATQPPQGNLPTSSEATAKRIDVLEQENATLRDIISRCATALENGAYVSPKASLEFMAELPVEISLLIKSLKASSANQLAVPIEQMPDWANWQATDEDGDVRVYEDRPKPYSFYWDNRHRAENSGSALIKKGPECPDWRNSLIDLRPLRAAMAAARDNVAAEAQPQAHPMAEALRTAADDIDNGKLHPTCLAVLTCDAHGIIDIAPGPDTPPLAVIGLCTAAIGRIQDMLRGRA